MNEDKTYKYSTPTERGINVVSPIELFISIDNHWGCDRFTIGAHIAGDDLITHREFYILLSFIFWQISFGIKIKREGY